MNLWSTRALLPFPKSDIKDVGGEGGCSDRGRVELLYLHTRPLWPLVCGFTYLILPPGKPQRMSPPNISFFITDSLRRFTNFHLYSSINPFPARERSREWTRVLFSPSAAFVEVFPVHFNQGDAIRTRSVRKTVNDFLHFFQGSWNYLAKLSQSSSDDWGDTDDAVCSWESLTFHELGKNWLQFLLPTEAGLVNSDFISADHRLAELLLFIRVPNIWKRLSW